MSAIARSCLVVLVCSVIPGPLLASCGTEKRNIPVDRNDYKELQRFVNEGHEPWRQDAKAVAAEEVLKLEQVSKGYDVFAVPLNRVEETQRKAVFSYDSNVHPDVSYRVTVKRPSWLLPLAKRWQWMIWVPSEVEVTRCPKVPAHSGAP